MPIENGCSPNRSPFTLQHISHISTLKHIEPITYRDDITFTTTHSNIQTVKAHIQLYLCIIYDNFIVIHHLHDETKILPLHTDLNFTNQVLDLRLRLTHVVPLLDA